MANPFFDQPILNSPYERPSRHWELDAAGQPTQKIVENRRKAEFISPIPKAKKRKESKQQSFVFNEGEGLSTQTQQYETTSVINKVRNQVERWRSLSPSEWQVTPETARLLQHWRHHKFSGVRPFFCQIEAVETAIWLTEVTPKSEAGKRLLIHLGSANNDANPGLNRLALKLATGAGKTTVMVKNHSMGFEAPYRWGSETRHYRPDFILRIDDGCGDDDLLNLIVEIKGYRGEDAKEKKSTMETYWVPGVTQLKSFSRWSFAEFTDVYEMENDFKKKVKAEFDRMIANVRGLQ